ncbi:MAG TPA: zinc-dependent alcohol dehydrogenase family protein [Terriglobales bacterium]|nr:zinc-dependent alcohol dehydrogenase family protein [Terriglobales bacterium]
MKALVYEGPGVKHLLERPVPGLQMGTDAILRMATTTICGTDLHILKGDVPSCTPGRILGHEGTGVVEEVGAAVASFRPGDPVLISCISACAHCPNCRRGMYSHCENGGWTLGNTIDGTQAEYVRIPHADTSLYPIPEGAPSDAWVLLSDVFPTSYECGILNAKIKPGASVAIVGAGPIGLAALLTAQLYSPGPVFVLDKDTFRLQIAKTLGATGTVEVNGNSGAAAAHLFKLNGGQGVDAVIEAVGVPESFLLCEELVAPGGIIANIGVHGTKVDLHLEQLWDRNIAITTRLVDTSTTPLLMRMVRNGRLNPMPLITHRFRFDEMPRAYDVFGQAAVSHALKVLIQF